MALGVPILKHFRVTKRILFKQLYHTKFSKTIGLNSVDPDEVAHYEPPYLAVSKFNYRNVLKYWDIKRQQIFHMFHW